MALGFLQELPKKLLSVNVQTTETEGSPAKIEHWQSVRVRCVVVGAAAATARTTTVLFMVITLPFLDFQVRSSTLAIGRHTRVFLNFFFTTHTTLSGIHTLDSCI